MTPREDPSAHPTPASPPELAAGSVAAALLAGLAGWGLHHVFIVPGQQIDPLNRALSRSAQLRPVVANHELAAGYMADGYARAGGGIGACFAIGGPGAANLVGAAIAAKADRSPVLFVTGLLPAAARAPGAFQDGGPLGANDGAVMGAALAASFTCGSAAELPAAWRRLSQRLAAGEPAHLALGHDVQQDSATASAGPVLRAVPAADRGADRCDGLAGLMDDLAAEGRVALYVTRQAIGCAAAVRELATRWALPVITDLAARGVLPEGAAGSAGHDGFMPHPRALAVLQAASPLRAQRIVLLSDDTRHRSRLLAGHDRVRVLNPAALRAGWPLAPAALPAAGVLAQRRHWWHTLAQIRRPPPVHAAAAGVLPHVEVIDALVGGLPAETAWVVDAGQVRRIAVARLACQRPRSLFVAEGMAPMGWALGAAVGVACAQPATPVVALVGDGAMRMHGIELATAARYRLPILYVLFDNQAYGSVLARAGDAAEAALARLPPVDWLAFAAAFGVAALPVADASALRAALADAGRLQAPRLLVVRVPAVDADAFSEPTGLDWPPGDGASAIAED